MNRARGWRQKHERELADFFSGSYKAGAGLHSGGLALTGGASSCNPNDIEPPKVVELFGNSERTVMLRAEHALCFLRESDDGAQRHAFEVLAAHYTPSPPGCWNGFPEVKNDRAVAALTDAVRGAAESWMRHRCHAETEAELKARDDSEKAIERRLEELRLDLKNATTDHARESIDRRIRAIKLGEQRLDVVARVRERWSRPPSRSELVAALKRICVATRGGSKATAAERTEARKLCRLADSQAKRDLLAAQREYGRIRDEVDDLYGAEAEAKRFAARLGLPVRKNERAR